MAWCERAPGWDGAENAAVQMEAPACRISGVAPGGAKRRPGDHSFAER